jgi:hypothetical protein
MLLIVALARVARRGWGSGVGGCAKLCLIVHGAGFKGRDKFSERTKPILALESIACENLRSQFRGKMGG